MTYRFHPEAQAELHEAIAFYQERGFNLGEDFAFQVFAAVQRMIAHPAAWPIVDDPVRRCLVNRFPYAILYAIESDHLAILAIMHLHRHPAYWKKRV